MKDLTQLDAYRQRTPRVLARYGSFGDQGNGVFSLPSPRGGGALLCIASNGDGWDHVSVSLPNRCPNWPEMEHVKRLFFADDETAMQLHVPPADHGHAGRLNQRWVRVPPAARPARLRS